MFVYTVYPLSGARKSKNARRVEPVSRVSPVHPVVRTDAMQDNAFYIPEIKSPKNTGDNRDQSDNGYVINDTAYTGHNQNNEEWREDALFVQSLLPVLLAWRYPKSAVSTDYIQKHCEQLYATMP